MKTELRIFFTAMMFYTRIPCPAWVDHNEAYINKATRYFPLIGWIVGAASAGVLYFFSVVTNMSLAIIFSMVTGILITGAFHEDGFADVCDGFGGGWTKEKILAIMKDSRVGAYGVIGMILLLLCRYTLLNSHQGNMACLLLLVAHPLSRFAAVLLLSSYNYVRDDESAKAKPIAKKIAPADFILAGIFGLVPMLIFRSALAFAILIPLGLLVWYLGNYFKKWIGGYTGDCLGATQQLSEILIYLYFLILWKYI